MKKRPGCFPGFRRVMGTVLDPAQLRASGPLQKMLMENTWPVSSKLELMIQNVCGALQNIHPDCQDEKESFICLAGPEGMRPHMTIRGG